MPELLETSLVANVHPRHIKWSFNPEYLSVFVTLLTSFSSVRFLKTGSQTINTNIHNPLEIVCAIEKLRHNACPAY